MTKLITFVSEAMFALVNYVVGCLQIALPNATSTHLAASCHQSLF